MTWNVWDVLIILAALAQIGVLVWVVLIALKIKNGPVKAITGHIAPLTERGKTLAETGKREALQNKDRFAGLAAEVKGIVDAVKPRGDGAGDALPGASINWHTIKGAWGTYRTVQRGLKGARMLRRLSAAQTVPPGPKGAPGKANVSLAERLGLIPPAAKHLGRAWSLISIGLQVRKQLKARGARG